MNTGETRYVRRSRASIRAYWRGHVAAQASSGLVAAEYCRAYGLHPNSFYRWRQVLGASGKPGGGEATPLFAEVRLPAGATASDPFTYLRDLLRRIPTHPNRDIDALFPDRWANTTQ